MRTEYSTLGDAVRAVFQNWNLKKRDFARIAGVDENNVSRNLKPNGAIKDKHARAAAEMTGCRFVIHESGVTVIMPS